jgi:hypothetical protein
MTRVLKNSGRGQKMIQCLCPGISLYMLVTRNIHYIFSYLFAVCIDHKYYACFALVSAYDSNDNLNNQLLCKNRKTINNDPVVCLLVVTIMMINVSCQQKILNATHHGVHV